MNAELLSRIQFALTVSFHFIYPPLSMGLGVMLIVMGIIYLRTKDPMWRRLVILLGEGVWLDLCFRCSHRHCAGI